MLVVVLAWAFVLGGLIMGVIGALNLVGLAPRWLRTTPMGPFENLGLATAGAGLAGFFWSIPVNDAPVEAWRDYWLWVGAAGLILFGAPSIWRWAQASRTH